MGISRPGIMVVISVWLKLVVSFISNLICEKAEIIWNSEFAVILVNFVLFEHFLGLNVGPSEILTSQCLIWYMAYLYIRSRSHLFPLHCEVLYSNVQVLKRPHCKIMVSSFILRIRGSLSRLKDEYKQWQWVLMKRPPAAKRGNSICATP